jgi:hypothetical protein
MRMSSDDRNSELDGNGKMQLRHMLLQMPLVLLGDWISHISFGMAVCIPALLKYGIVIGFNSITHIRWKHLPRLCSVFRYRARFVTSLTNQISPFPCQLSNHGNPIIMATLVWPSDTVLAELYHGIYYIHCIMTAVCVSIIAIIVIVIAV